MEPFLPKVPLPALAAIDAVRIAPVRFGACPAQTIGRTGHQDQVHVVRHQAVRAYTDPGHYAPPRYLGEISAIVLVVEDRRQPPDATLRNVVSDTGNDDAGHSSHGARLPEPERHVKNKQGTLTRHRNRSPSAVKLTNCPHFLDDWLPSSKSTVSFLARTAGRSKGSGVASVMAVASGGSRSTSSRNRFATRFPHLAPQPDGFCSCLMHDPD